MLQYTFENHRVTGQEYSDGLPAQQLLQRIHNTLHQIDRFHQFPCELDEWPQDQLDQLQAELDQLRAELERGFDSNKWVTVRNHEDLFELQRILGKKIMYTYIDSDDRGLAFRAEDVCPTVVTKFEYKRLGFEYSDGLPAQQLLQLIHNTLRQIDQIHQVRAELDEWPQDQLDQLQAGLDQLRAELERGFDSNRWVTVRNHEDLFELGRILGKKIMYAYIDSDDRGLAFRAEDVCPTVVTKFEYKRLGFEVGMA